MDTEKLSNAVVSNPVVLCLHLKESCFHTGANNIPEFQYRY